MTNNLPIYMRPKTLDDSSNIGTQHILYDFSKAFDLMDHQILLQKFKFMSFPDRLISLVADYLRNAHYV